MKKFPLKHERASLNAGVEAFNLTNHPNFLRLSPYFVTDGVKLNSYFQPVEMLNPRQIEFFLTLEY